MHLNVVLAGPHAPHSLYKQTIAPPILTTQSKSLHTQKTLLQLHLAAAQKLQFKSPMAQVSISSAFFFVLVALAAATVSAQESAPAPAPMDAGAAYSLPVNGAVVGASLMVSVFALFKHYLN